MFSFAGENFVKDGSADKARSAAVMARKELKLAAAVDEYAKRLAALELAIITTNQAHQLRQKAFHEIDGVLKCLNLAQVQETFCLFPVTNIFADFNAFSL